MMFKAVEIIERLGDNARANAWMKAAFEDGLQKRYWPPRAAPTGEEHCAILRNAYQEIIGAATFFPIANEQYWVDLVYVSLFIRENGVGKALLSAVKKHCDDLGATGILFGTGIDNLAMQRIGRSLCFVPDHIVFSTRTWATDNAPVQTLTPAQRAD